MFESEQYSFPLLNWVRFPSIEIDKKQKKSVGLEENATNFEFLQSLSRQALSKTGFVNDKRYNDRLEFELNLVNKLGFTDYFLLVWKVINKMKELNAFLDYGRGSAAGSLVFYVLGVTGVDPVKKKLLFARFISEVRAKSTVIDGVTYVAGDLAPDVDLNLGGARDEIIKWLNKEYNGRVCQISTVGTLSGKLLIKDVYKINENVDETEAQRVANLVEKVFGIVEDIEKMPEKNPEFKEWSQKHKETFEIALKLRDLIRQKGSHASGYFIAYDTLMGNYPLDLSKDKTPILSYEMSTAAQLGIKLDCLGLTTNQIIQEILDDIDETIEEINPKLENDELIYGQYQHGTLLRYGLYQISADCAYKGLLAIKPKNLDELTDLNAIARPGALSYLDGYVKGDNPCPHPAFETILRPTRNYCLYQEQMIQMAVALGFSAENGEILRRVVGKKKIDEVKLWKERVYETCQKNGFNKDIGDLFWKILDDSSKYSFNLSHAAATASLSALTTYLKYKYPIKFYTACLNNIEHFPNPHEHLSEIAKELPFFGIKLCPPKINNSSSRYTYNGDTIFMPITSIKGISKKAIDKLNRFKVQSSNKLDIFRAGDEANIPRNIFSALVLAGGMDEFLNGASRSRLLLEYTLWKKLTDKEKELCSNVFEKFGKDLFLCVKELNENLKDDKGKPLIQDSRRQTVKDFINPHWKLFKQNEANVDIAYYFFERELLGFAYSRTLLDIYKSKVPDLSTLQQVSNGDDKEHFRFIGIIEEAKRGVSKKGTKYYKMVISDETEKKTIFMFSTARQDTIGNCENVNGRLPAENDIVICSGQKNGDSVFLDSCGVQDISVWLKVSQMPD